MKCPECHGNLVFLNRLEGEIICKKCGLVISQDQTRQGFVEWTPKWLSNWSEEDSDTLREWLTTLRTVSCQLNLPSFPYREEAARIIRLKKDILFRSQRFGKNKKEAVAALIHLVLRRYNKMRPLKEICQTLSLDHRQVMKYAWTMRKMGELHKTFSAKDYLGKYGWKLTSDAALIQTVEQLLTSIRKKISGNPMSLAAGALYFVCKSKGIKISKDEIGEAFCISGRTVYSNERRIRKLMSSKSFSILT